MKRSIRARAGLLLVVVFDCLMGSAAAQTTQIVSLTSGGSQGNGTSGNFGLALSPDARFVAFSSGATNFDPADGNLVADIFVKDRQTGAIERVSVSTSGIESNAQCEFPVISQDGRYVAYWTPATTLVVGDTNGSPDIFLRDRQAGTTERVSIGVGGVQGNGITYGGSMTPDGRFVAFSSTANNLVPGYSNNQAQIYLRDRTSGVTEIVSVDSGELIGNGESREPSISSDGRYVAFVSWSTNLSAGDTNQRSDAFVRDRLNGTTERVSVSQGGALADDSSYSTAISPNGRKVAFSSDATNLVAGDTNGVRDVFVRDRVSATTVRASVSSLGVQTGADCGTPSFSADGRRVVFISHSGNLVPGDNNNALDVFVRDLTASRTERVSVATGPVQANGDSELPAMSADGRWVAFASVATNLVPGDVNAAGDVFLHDRQSDYFTSLCEPGVSGVVACPCSNPPLGPGRGCDNSSGTGGASLTATGFSQLSADTLLFVSTGQRAAATSIVLQGNSSIAAGAVYGQGVRCVGGALKRLFVKSAVNGCVTAPDLSAGDPSVSARSAAKGDTILPAQTRWYLIYYRDPTILGGCPTTSYFNATQSGAVFWDP